MKHMKLLNIYFTGIVMILTLCLTSCELDNYDGPNAEIYGGAYDYETGELVRQDIISGAQIEYVEQGWETPQTQYMIFKSDGTYTNKLMFSATYTMQIRTSNFVPISEQEVVVKGKTELNFTVQPYIRVKDVSITEVGDEIVAKFKLQTTIANKNVKTIGLYAHIQDFVGQPANRGKAEKTLNAIVPENIEYELRLKKKDISHPDVLHGRDYYFIVGALIDVSGAKYNYSAPVKIGI